MSEKIYGVFDGHTREILVENITSEEARDWITAYSRNKLNKKRQLSAFKMKQETEESACMSTHGDEAIARFYIMKIEQASSNGIEFGLSFAQFKRLSQTSRCRFTGIKLTEDTFSIDRIDNSKGYVAGNVATCHKQFNQIKGIAENPNSELTINAMARGFSIVRKMLK